MCDNHDNSDRRAASLDGMHRRDLVKRLGSGVLVLGAAGTSGCASVGKFLEPSDTDLAPMAAQAWAETKSQTPISNDAKANQRLQTVGKKIASVANVPNAQWEFVVFDSKELNAFCLPGGKVGFYKGLMDFVDNDDQVAAVLGHEVGHVVARHAAKRAGEQQAEALGLAGFQMAVGGKLNQDQMKIANSVFGMGLNLASGLPFSRSNESEADKLGVDYMKLTGYDVKQAVKLWEKMGAASANRPQEWMSTHPDPSRRAKELREYIIAKGYATF